MKLLVLVVGAGGQLGEAMTDQLSVRHEVVAVPRAGLDITDAAAVRKMTADITPDVIVNCSAFTNVDGAEDDPVQALAINAMGVGLLARAVNDLDATLVHYSTDFVFDGQIDRPYTEDDAPNPRGVYAMSKLLGEWFAAEARRHYVLRVESLFGGSRPHSSIDRMVEQLRAGTTIRAFSDRTVSPSYVDDVVAATGKLIETRAAPGVYHCVNSGWTTWSGIARELATLLGLPDAPIEEIRMADAKLRAPRPLFAALSNEKLTKAGIPMPAWQDALARYVRDKE